MDFLVLGSRYFGVIFSETFCSLVALICNTFSLHSGGYVDSVLAALFFFVAAGAPLLSLHACQRSSFIQSCSRRSELQHISFAHDYVPSFVHAATVRAVFVLPVSGLKLKA